MGRVTHADSPWDGFAGVTITVARYPGYQRQVVTDANGEYRLEDLPPGDLLVVLAHDETMTSDFRDIQLAEGQTLRLDVRLVEGPLDAMTLEWGYHKVSPPTRFRLSEDVFGRAFPELKYQRPARDQGNTVRSVDSALELAEGARVTRAGLSLHGSSGLGADYRLEGLSTVDPAFGTNALPVHSSFLEPIELSWGSTDARSGGGTGARIDATLMPTAFRVFSGSAFMSWAPGVLEGARAPLGAGDALPRATSLGNQGDLGGSFTGPIIPKRLAVFLGVAPILSRSRVGSASTPFLDQRGVQSIARLTLQSPHTAGSVDLTFITMPTERRPALAATSEVSRPPSIQDTTTQTSLALKGYLGGAEIQARVGWLHRRGDVETPFDEQEGPPTPPSWRKSTFSTDRYQASVDAERRFDLLGQHWLTAGIEAEALRYSHAVSPPDTFVQGPEVRTRGSVLRAYVQDSWSPRFSYAPDLNFGVRYDAQQILPANGGPTLHVGEQVSPRLELIVPDLIPWLDSRLFVRYGSTVSLLPLSLAERAGGNPSALVAPTSRDFFLGLQHLSFGHSQLSVTYLHRKLDAPLEGLLRSPASRARARRYEALSVVLRQEKDSNGRNFYLSYTRSNLSERGAGRVRAPFARRPLDGEGPTLFDAAVSDRPDSIRAYLLRDLPGLHKWRPKLSVSYLVESGAWMEGAPTRLPWVHTFDASVSFSYWIEYTGTVTFGLDVFNILNFQTVTRTDATGAPAEYQPPRQLRFQARYDF
ncbi:TonB-dependent receptor [Myxococcus stipitatus]|uniref:TonB-dependent receptor n=1 Tax=Myxococcus stipitatus TaxID=83455 RepID=UPI0031454520